MPQVMILSDVEVLHRSEACGPRITRIQTAKVGSMLIEYRWWHEVETNKLVKIDESILNANQFN